LVSTVGTDAANHVLAGSSYSLTTENAAGTVLAGTYTIKNTSDVDTYVAWNLRDSNDGTWDNSDYVNNDNQDLAPGASITITETFDKIDGMLAVTSTTPGSSLNVKFAAGSASASKDLFFDGAAAAGLTAGSISAVVGTADLSATWTANSNVNLDQLAWSLTSTYSDGDLGAGYLEGNGAISSHSNYSDAAVASGALKVTFNHTVTSAETYSAALWYDDNVTGGAGWTKFSTAIVYGSSVNPVTDKVSTPVGVVSANLNVNTNPADAHGDLTNLVRSGTKSVDVSAVAIDADEAAVAGKDALVTIALDHLAGGSIKAGGETLTNSTVGGEISFHATTDAAGKVAFTMVNSGAADADSVEVTVQVETKESHTGTFTWADAEYTLGHAVLNANGNADRSVVVGSSFTLAYAVHDQWGATNPGSAYTVSLSKSVDDAREKAATWSYPAASVGSNGTVSFAITDNGVGTGSDTVTATLNKAGDNNNVTTVDDVNSVVTYEVAAALAASTITATAEWTTATDRANLTDLTGRLRSIDSQFDDSEFIDTWGCSGLDWVNGTVSGAASAGIDGILVTASATDAWIGVSTNGPVDYQAAKNTVSQYSIDGSYSFYVCSSHPGKNTITITAGGVTKTVDVYFKSSAAKTVALSVNGGAATAQTGRSVAVTATVKDANGNLVPDRVVTFATSGLGSLDSATATTDANGVATVHYLTGSAETGVVDFTATVATANASDIAVEQATAVVSSKVTETFTRADGNVTHKKNKVTAHWSAAAGQKVIVVIDGYRRYTQVELADAANSYSKVLKKGRHVVNLYIGGVLVDSHKFTVKK